MMPIVMGVGSRGTWRRSSEPGCWVCSDNHLATLMPLKAHRIRVTAWRSWVERRIRWVMPIMMGVLPGAREQTLLRNGVCHVLPTVKVQNLAAGSAAPAIRILCVKVWPEDLILTPYEGQHLREFGMVDSEADDAPLVEQRPKLTLASLVGGSTGCNLTGVCVFFLPSRVRPWLGRLSSLLGCFAGRHGSGVGGFISFLK